ncbi:hypothetical protein [Enterococcus avium]|uniref:hypothetical protein n=1 Tax=Enterococcus avium TaxID=33945 RepID=UPI00288EB827|nr:hypothetical protein [Enterococcus avium]MDT2383512.1 hypothetical protein [Enterococcus avium]
MKKIYWIRRLFLLATMFSVGAVSVTKGVIPDWIKIFLGCSIGGYLLLMAEFEFELRSRANGR